MPDSLNFRFTRAQFFDRPVASGLSKEARRVLSRFGAFVRKRAKSVLGRRYAKPVSSVASLPKEQRRSYKIRLNMWKRRQVRTADGRFASKQGVKPSLPDDISRPGEPPFIRRRLYAPFKNKSPLRELIFFAYDPKEQAVIVGPEQFTMGTQGAATSALEHGGQSFIRTRTKKRSITVAARPFMRPAFEAELPNLRKWKRGIF